MKTKFTLDILGKTKAPMTIEITNTRKGSGLPYITVRFKNIIAFLEDKDLKAFSKNLNKVVSKIE